MATFYHLVIKLTKHFTTLTTNIVPLRAKTIIQDEVSKNCTAFSSE